MDYTLHVTLNTMKRIKVGLNGFGRIGRSFARIGLLRDSFDIVAINTRKTKPDILAYLLQYDSVYRRFEKKVDAQTDGLTVAEKKIFTTNTAEPSQIPWENFGVDLVVDATGAFTTTQDLRGHIRGSVKKVVLTAPSDDEETPHVVLGVNEEKIDLASSQIISNCSCTTNCAALLIKTLHDSFNLLTSFLTTTHAYTQTQSLLDDAAKSKERSRAASQNIVPSTTGAATAVVKTLPQLAGKIDGMSIRVPVPAVSFAVVSVLVERPTTVEEVNQKFKEVSLGSLKNVLGYETEVLVSSDFIGSPYSCIFDANYTRVLNEHLINVFGWYDNEWGYSTRLVDLIEKMSDYV